MFIVRIKTEEVSDIAEQSQVSLNLQSGPTFSFDLIHKFTMDEAAMHQLLGYIKDDAGLPTTEYLTDSVAALLKQRVH